MREPSSVRPLSVESGEKGKKRKVKNRSAKGRRNEHKSRDLLEQAGYYVIRAAASKGDWDLVAIPHTNGLSDILLVQVKTNRVPRALLPEQVPKGFPQNVTLLYHVWWDYDPLPQVFDAVTKDRKMHRLY